MFVDLKKKNLLLINIEGMSIYYDGVLMGETDRKIPETHESGSGQMVIGRRYYDDSDEKFVSMEIDELTLWNN